MKSYDSVMLEYICTDDNDPLLLKSVGGCSASASCKSTVDINCEVYGHFKITEPALVDLIESPAVQRLKGVFQAGIGSNVGLCGDNPVTRYGHSVGAMLLVRQAGADVETQAAALLHDIAHTSLSHVADSVYKYVVHEVDKIPYLENTTSVIDILTHHFGKETTDRILNEENYPLLERHPPALCADRMDYGLRDSVNLGYLTGKEARDIAADFTPFQGRFVQRSSTLARRFAEAYMACDQTCWANNLHGILYTLCSQTIQLALQKGHLCKADLWKYSDVEFWNLFVHSPDPEIRKLASYVRHDLVVSEILGEEEEEAIAGGGNIESEEGQVIEMCFKIRTLDPDILLDDGRVLKLSEVDTEYRSRRDEYIKRRQRSIRCRVSLPPK